MKYYLYQVNAKSFRRYWLCELLCHLWHYHLTSLSSLIQEALGQNYMHQMRRNKFCPGLSGFAITGI